MMKKSITLFIAVIITAALHAQLCPGGGTSFSNAVLFDPAWIAGCSNGTTCTGGSTFDNRASCEPTTAMEACAVNPACGVFANMGSDLWYKFYATATTATITVNQNVSFVASIQALEGGPLCNALTEKGCIIAAGPSGGVSLSLTGLTVNNLYYFRVFGTSSSSAQRTGTFCFCGSAGMSNTLLPVRLVSFNAAVSDNSSLLTWVTSAQINFNRFEIERSANGTDFITTGNKTADNSSSPEHHYTYRDYTPLQGNNFYRLKMIDNNGRFEYSPVVKINTNQQLSFTAVMDNRSHQLYITSNTNCEIDIYTVQGAKIATVSVKKGNNAIAFTRNNGVYILKKRNGNESKEIAVFN